MLFLMIILPLCVAFPFAWLVSIIFSRYKKDEGQLPFYKRDSFWVTYTLLFFLSFVFCLQIFEFLDGALKAISRANQ